MARAYVADALGALLGGLLFTFVHLNMLLWGQFSGSGLVDWLERLQRLGPWPYLVPPLLFVALWLVRTLLEGGGMLDATNADLKAFDDGFYRRINGATLRPVLDALVTFREEGVWTELTNLVIPTLNDDLAMIRRMARWIVAELGANTPLHFSRFHPEYRMRNLPPTPTETLQQARAAAQDAGLDYAYLGNVMGDAGMVGAGGRYGDPPRGRRNNEEGCK